MKNLIDFITCEYSQIMNTDVISGRDEVFYDLEYIDLALSEIPKNIENSTINEIYKQLSIKIKQKRNDLLVSNNTN